MSKNRFLAKYGSEKHVNDIMKDRQFISDVLRNPLLSPVHINTIINGNFQTYHKRAAVTHPNASHENLMNAITHANDDDWEAKYLGSGAIRRIDATDKHVDKVLDTGNNNLIYHTLVNDDFNKYQSRHLEKLASHPVSDIRIVVASHYNTSNDVLKKLSDDSSESVSLGAKINLQNRGIEV